MRILLSGTSNAIIANGIKKGLATDPRVARFANASYGASGTVAIGEHLHRIDWTQYDACILDYCVNEEEYIFDGTVTLEEALSNIHAMVDAASRAGCLPVVVIFPDHFWLNRRRPFGAALKR